MLNVRKCLALATLAYEVWRSRREGAKPKVTPQPRGRWSGRRPR